MPSTPNAIDALPDIFECGEYMGRRRPPYHEHFDRQRMAMMPVIFSFAYTPKGKVSVYWCSLTFNYPYPAQKAIDDWEKRRPRLRKGYRWSRVYKYSGYIK